MPGQRAAIDPATGQLRPLEHDDVVQMPQAAAFGVEPQERPGARGGVMIAVPEDLYTFTVATRTPDGKVAIEHTTGAKSANQAVAAAKQGSKGVVKENVNDR